VNALARPLLISVGIVGVIGRHVHGRGLTAELASVTPVCAERTQEIPGHLVPGSYDPAPFTFFAYSIAAIRDMSRIAPVVLLANASCADLDVTALRQSLSPWISGIFLSCDTGYAAPDPAAFSCITTRYKTPPDQAIHIGEDWACDTVGAVSAGVGTIWLSHGRPVPDPALAERGTVAVATDLVEVARLLAVTRPAGSPS
jgi:FMN phosphatase YigB (HAD superfamily)